MYKGLGDWSDIIDSIGNTATKIITSTRSDGTYQFPPYNGGPTVPVYYPGGAQPVDPYLTRSMIAPADGSSWLPYVLLGVGAYFLLGKRR